MIKSNGIVPVFDTKYDTAGNLISGRMSLVIDTYQIDSNGEFNEYKAGQVFSSGPSIVFIIDMNTYNQIEKLKIAFIDGLPNLVVKDGEEFEEIEDQETPEEKEIRELQEKLAALMANKK